MQTDNGSTTGGVSRRQFLQGAGGAAAVSAIVTLPKLARGQAAEPRRPFASRLHLSKNSPRPHRPRATRGADLSAALSSIFIPNMNHKVKRNLSPVA